MDIYFLFLDRFQVKRLLTYLASEQAERVIGELMVEMQVSLYCLVCPYFM